MPITKIIIENFKGIKDRVEIPIRPITLLFGANSAGKSTVLHALLYLRELLERQNADADRVIGGGKEIYLGGFRQLVHGHDQSKTVTVGVDFDVDADGLEPYPISQSVTEWTEDDQPTDPVWKTELVVSRVFRSSSMLLSQASPANPRSRTIRSQSTEST